MPPRLALAAIPMAALAGCTTVVPMQTASTVPVGEFRLGAQGTITPYCTAGNFLNCALLPDALPLPEVGVSLRHGLRDGFDLGGVFRASGTVAGDDHGGVQLGMLADAKAEVFASNEGGRRQLVSVGAGLGFNWQHPFGLKYVSTPQSYYPRDAEDLFQFDLAIPIFYGLQVGRGEVVVSPRFWERITLEPSGTSKLTWAPYGGLAVALISGGPNRIGLQLSYEAPAAYPGDGLWNLAVGGLWTLGTPP